MPVNDKPRRPRPNPITSILLFIPALLLMVNLVVPFITGPRIPKVPYSFFLEQVQDEQVARVSVGQDVIRYQIKNADGEPGQVQETTPIFDLELPKLPGRETWSLYPSTDKLHRSHPPLIFR